MTRYFHGGPPGLTKILPPTVTGARGLAPYGTGQVSQRDKVYITTDFTDAMVYAVGEPSGKGVVYQVQPAHPLEPDPDCLIDGLSYACRSAQIVKVYEVSDQWRAIVMQLLAQQAQGKATP